MDYIPTKRHQVAKLFLAEQITQAKESSPPTRSDERWDNPQGMVIQTFYLLWVKTPHEVKLAFYFAKYPHWYEIDEVKVINDVEAYIPIDPK